MRRAAYLGRRLVSRRGVGLVLVDEGEVGLKGSVGCPSISQSERDFETVSDGTINSGEMPLKV